VRAILSLAILLGVAPARAADPVPVPYAPVAPAIGTGEAWYASAVLLTFTAAYVGGDNTVTLSGVWHEDALYLAAGVEDPLLYATPTPRDSALTWENDAIELLFDPTLQGGTSVADGDQAFRQYIVTIANGLFDAYGCCATADRSFTGQATSYVTLDGTLNGPGNGYLIEVRLPWSDLGVSPTPGLVFGLDVANDDRDDLQVDPIIQSDWAQLTTSFGQPSQWARLELVGGADGGVADGGVGDGGADGGDADGPAADGAATDAGGGSVPVGPGSPTMPTPAAGCSCAAGAAVGPGLGALALLVVARMRRRR
jgi:MYXO-CTERM domain-containing protein